MIKIFRLRQKIKLNLLKTNISYTFSKSQTTINYYKTLNLKPGCSQEQLKVSYLQMVKKYHPDLNQSPDASQKFRQIQQAYDYLLQPSNRIKYTEQKNSLRKESYTNQQQERDQRIRQFRQRFYRNYKRKKNIPQQMQFSYRLFKKHDQKINEKKKEYTKYHGNFKQYWAKNDEEWQPVWKTFLIASGMIGIGVGTIWIVNMK